MSKRIGDFEIVGRLEAHAGAASYLARHATDGSSATIDIWTPETPDAQARFLDRATASERLEHDGIARILDFGIDGTTSCRIEAFADGETLAEKLRQTGDLKRETILAWLAQIARALEYAHGLGVVHGDLHPGLVTIRSDATVHCGASPIRAQPANSGIAPPNSSAAKRSMCGPTCTPSVFCSIAWWPTSRARIRSLAAG